MKGKTLIYSPSHGIWGGGQIYIEQLCDYMNENGTETYVLTSEPETFKCPSKKMENVLSRRKRFFSSAQIARMYKKEGFGTIILNDLSSLWLAPVFKLYGYKVVSLLHLYLQKRSQNPLGHSNAEYWLLRFAAKFCDAIFSVNKENQTIFGEKHVKFIGNYVPDWFIDASALKDEKKYDFILIARLSEQKNIPLFLEFLFRLNQRSSAHYSALIVGEGPQRDEIEHFIREKKLSEDVELRDWVKRDALPNVYDLGKCFVISSYHEGFATTLLEAHARGIPAIVTRSSGFCGEFVEGYNAPTGIVFEPQDLDNEAFFEDIEGLIKEYKSYKEKCITKARIFSQENVLGPILEAVKA